MKQIALLLVFMPWLTGAQAQTAYEFSYMVDGMGFTKVTIAGGRFKIDMHFLGIIRQHADSTAYEYVTDTAGIYHAVAFNAKGRDLLNFFKPDFYDGEARADTTYAAADTVVNNLAARKVTINYIRTVTGARVIQDTVKSVLLVATGFDAPPLFSFTSMAVNGLIIEETRSRAELSIVDGKIHRKYKTSRTYTNVSGPFHAGEDFFMLPPDCRYYQDRKAFEEALPGYNPDEWE